MNEYIAAIDIGTSGCKTILVSSQGEVVSSVTKEYPLYSIRPGWNEQLPKDWFEAVCSGMKQTIQASHISPEQIRTVSLTGQMHGLVPMDQDGTVIRPAILWNDQRCEDECREILEIAGGLDGLLSCTNNNIIPGYQAGKILWLSKHEPENFSRMKKALLPKDYIRYELTGEYATEVSDASGTGLFDVKNRCWTRGLPDKLGFDKTMFPTCHESQAVTGQITAAAAKLTGLCEGTSVIGGGGDSVVQTTGMGLIKSGILGITLGTAGVVAMASETFRQNDGKLQFFCNNAPDLYHIMGVQLAGGGSYQWYRNNLCQLEMNSAKMLDIDPYDIMNMKASFSPVGARRLLYLPYLSGERCPYSDSNLRGTFVGLTQMHKKQDLTRAVMEGVTYGLRQIADTILNLCSHATPSRVIISGGGSRSEFWRQIISDVFQLPVYTVSGAKEGGAYGAALVGGVGAGIWKDLSQACSVIKTETETIPNPLNRSVYDEMYHIYDSSYRIMKPLFDQLSQSIEGI